MENSSIFKSGRYAPALFFLAAFGLTMVAYDDLTVTWKRIAAGLLMLGILAGVAGWLHESLAFLIKEWGTSENGNRWAKLAAVLTFTIIYAALAVFMVAGLNKLVDVWPFDDPKPAANANSQGTLPADATTSPGPSTDTPTK